MCALPMFRVCLPLKSHGKSINNIKKLAIVQIVCARSIQETAIVLPCRRWLYGINECGLLKNFGKKQLGFSSYKLNVRFLAVLGIESSCDETGAAVVDSNGNVLGEAINSQMRIHLANGGVLPPLAKDLHLEHIVQVVANALKRSNHSLQDLDAIATTVKPGLELSLLVGLNYSKHLIRHCRKPFIPIHHMEAHALTVRMVHKVDFPYLVLLVSGGHCQIAVVKSVDEFFLLGTTIDGAPGEVFDKIARRLKLRDIPEFRNLSGGQAVEKCALSGDPLQYEFTEPLVKIKDCNFAFCGFKSVAFKLIRSEEKRHEIEGDGIIPSLADVCASFQHGIARHLVKRIHRAMIFCEYQEMIPESNKTLVISGGVACNNYIRGALDILCENMGYVLRCPPPKLCTDNGIMVAWNGVQRFIAGVGIVDDVEQVDVEHKCPLGTDLTDKVRDAGIKIKTIKLDFEKMRSFGL